MLGAKISWWTLCFIFSLEDFMSPEIILVRCHNLVPWFGVGLQHFTIHLVPNRSTNYFFQPSHFPMKTTDEIPPWQVSLSTGERIRCDYDESVPTVQVELLGVDFHFIVSVLTFSHFSFFPSTPSCLITDIVLEFNSSTFACTNHGPLQP